MTIIGQHLIRVRNGQSVGLAHMAESEIAERVVTHCGRQMAWRSRAGRLMTAGPADPGCSDCPPRTTVAVAPV